MLIPVISLRPTESGLQKMLNLLVLCSFFCHPVPVVGSPQSLVSSGGFVCSFGHYFDQEVPGGPGAAHYASALEISLCPLSFL